MITLLCPLGHISFTYAIGHKVNSLLSEPSLSTCEIWLLPPTCVLCMIRYLEESHEVTTSNGTASEDAKYKDHEKKLREATATGRPAQPGRPAPEDPSRIYGRPEPPDVRRLLGPGRPPDTGRPTLSSARTTDADRTSDTTCPEPKRRTSDMHWTTGPSRATERPVPLGRPTPVRPPVCWAEATYPFIRLDYIYSSTSS